MPDLLHFPCDTTLRSFFPTDLKEACIYIYICLMKAERNFLYLSSLNKEQTLPDAAFTGSFGKPKSSCRGGNRAWRSFVKSYHDRLLLKEYYYVELSCVFRREKGIEKSLFGLVNLAKAWSILYLGRKGTRLVLALAWCENRRTFRKTVSKCMD